MFSECVEELVGSSDADLHERIGALELQRRRIEAELAAAIAVADARQLNQIDAHRSMRNYLKATCNWSNHEVGRWRSAAAVFDALPGVGDAWIGGRIGSPQVAALGRAYGNRRIRDALTALSSKLVEYAEALSFDDFTTAIGHFVRLADDDGSHDARDDAMQHRRARVDDNGGALDMSVFGGDGLTAAEMIAIHRRFCDREYQADVAARRALHGDEAGEHELARTPAQRAFDATVAIFRLAADAASTGTSAGAPASTVVNILIDQRAFARMQAGTGLAPTTLDGQAIDPFTGLAAPDELLCDLAGDVERLESVRCETDGGVPLHPHDVLRATLAGHIRRVVLDESGRVVDLGRTQRLYTGAAREAALLLLRRCEHPGCDLPAGFCEVDHNLEWVDGGPTDQANAGVLCGGHNTAKHRHRWRRRRSRRGRSYTVRADGTIMLPVGVTRPMLLGDTQRLADPNDDAPVHDAWCDRDRCDDDWHDPADPDEIERLRHLARQRLRSLLDCG
ncbi:MAG: DUF222 domain-containing protein [Ilumatobacter sp.]|uniref:HNH endonuclease signature motif containing protein n=1 Tax=Ilumatobacter sp. TaxID=1967498 RepID=UPI0039194B30